MGTDIHVYVEKFEAPEGSRTPAWNYIAAEEKVLYFYPETMKEPFMGSYWYFSRNYSLFAMLANVRNGSGFAGSDTGDPITPISMPRGLPEGVSDEVSKEHDKWYGHDTSWFTLRELEMVDWDANKTTHRGWISAREYEQHFLVQGYPSAYSGDVSGGYIHHVSNAEMDALLAGPMREDVLGPEPDGPYLGNGNYYTQVQWTETWRESAGPEWFELLDQLKTMTKDDGSDVRIVFWFDS